MTKQFGTLHGIGVGPGDPELLTLKAVGVLRRVGHVFAAASTRNDSSLALSIAAPHLPGDARVQMLGFPMTRDAEVLERSWEENARRVLEPLRRGEDAAFLTLGDPMLYSTFGYLARTVRALEPEIAVQSVPGVTSFQAAASHTGTVLAESGENLLVLSGVGDAEELSAHLECADNAAVLKAYRNFGEIRETLRRLDLLERSCFVTRLGLDGEAVHTDLDQAPAAPHYFSLVLMKRGGSAPGRKGTDEA